MKTLIIAEKPSVATDLARVLAKAPGMQKFKRDASGSWYENDSTFITSAVGHLIEQDKPTLANGKPLPWKLEYLPCVPEKFKLVPIEKSKDRLQKITKLVKSNPDIGLIINACDAGREGELIFRNLQRYAGWKQPVKRLWMQSMTDDAILSAWAELRGDEEMRPLADAALCRSEADWLVGLNSTRALTAIRSSPGGFNMTPVGRVQTPTLAILAKRELEIRSFNPRGYYEVTATFALPAGESYQGKWIDENFKKKSDDDAKERIWQAADADAIVERCRGKQALIEQSSSKQSVKAPQLFDLTSLQREASNRFGFSARRTLQLAQECYEKHKVLTYPRTDSRYLPNDYVGKVAGVLQDIAASSSPLAIFAGEALQKKYVDAKDRRVFNSAKVSDHFAIIPTGKIDNLGGDVLRIFELVMARFIAVFFPAAEYEDTTRYSRIMHPSGSADCFLSTGRVLSYPGWRAVFGGKQGQSNKDMLAPVQNGSRAEVLELASEQNQTKPPARFNEATLLSAMEGAGKLVENDELAEAMRERGLGTPATRASIIEGLISDKYIEREGRNLIVTGRGLELMDQLDKINIQVLASPHMTGEWEYQLKQMEQGKLKRELFMHSIVSLTAEIVNATKQYISRDLPELQATCPLCGGVGFSATPLHLTCKNPACRFSLRRLYANRQLDDAELLQLLQHRRVGPLEGFKSKFGKAFSASLVIDEKGKVAFEFADEPRASSAEEQNKEFVCDLQVLDHGSQALYSSEKSYHLPGITGKKDPNGISIGKSILSREIPLAQIRKILGEGKSDLIKGFVSQRTKKSFDAYLVWDSKSFKVGFEFPPRPARGTSAKSQGDDANAAAPSGSAKKPSAKAAAKPAAKTASKKVAAKKAPAKSSSAKKAPKRSKPSDEQHES